MFHCNPGHSKSCCQMVCRLELSTTVTLGSVRVFVENASAKCWGCGCASVYFLYEVFVNVSMYIYYLNVSVVL